MPFRESRIPMTLKVLAPTVIELYIIMKIMMMMMTKKILMIIGVAEVEEDMVVVVHVGIVAITATMLGIASFNPASSES